MRNTLGVFLSLAQLLGAGTYPVFAQNVEVLHLPRASQAHAAPSGQEIRRGTISEHKQVATKPDPRCAFHLPEQGKSNFRQGFVVTASTGSTDTRYARGTPLAPDAVLYLIAGQTVQLCDPEGQIRTFSGPGTFSLMRVHVAPLPEATDADSYKKSAGAAAERDKQREREQQYREAYRKQAERERQASEAASAGQRYSERREMPGGSSSSAPAATPRAMPPPPAGAIRRARTGATRSSNAAQLKPYPVWPPEAPSSRARLDAFIASRANLSLYGAGEKLISAFSAAGYLEHSFYAAPGGFVLVTRIEKIGKDGTTLEGANRYRLPNQRDEPSLSDYLRNLFLEAPPGYYRYVAVIVTNRPYSTSSRSLDDRAAVARLRQGSSDLTQLYRSIPFTDAFRVDALIYEFQKAGTQGSVRMIEPGRLPPATHLARTGLDRAIRRSFAR